MVLRSQQTRWFEVYVRRDQVVYAVEALAATRSVQLERDPRFAGAMNTDALMRRITEFDRQADIHRDLLPDAGRQPTRLSEPLDDLVTLMLQRLQRWSERLDLLLAEADQLQSMRDQLLVLEEAALAMGESAGQLAQLAHSTGLLFKQLFRCAPDQVGRPEVV